MDRGLRLKAAREAAGLSQQYMAEQMGCSRQLIGSIESGGNVSVDQLETMCVHYRCACDSIVFGSAADAPDDLMAREFAKLEPAVRDRIWMLYQVFMRRGAAFDTAPSLPRG